MGHPAPPVRSQLAGWMPGAGPARVAAGTASAAGDQQHHPWLPNSVVGTAAAPAGLQGAERRQSLTQLQEQAAARTVEENRHALAEAAARRRLYRRARPLYGRVRLQRTSPKRPVGPFTKHPWISAPASSSCRRPAPSTRSRCLSRRFLLGTDLNLNKENNCDGKEQEPSYVHRNCRI